MRRREFIVLLGGATAAWPVVARAQRTGRIPTVGILLGSTDNPEVRRLLEAFMEAFKALGWTEDRHSLDRWQPAKQCPSSPRVDSPKARRDFCGAFECCDCPTEGDPQYTDRVRECV
jgi:hypothetical protein